jgi:hypothetical protein
VLPKELDDIFKEYSEDDFSLCITKLDYSTDNFIINFLLDVQNINDKGNIIQEWTITAAGHRKNNLSFDFEDFIEIKDDHSLLWEFYDTQCQLYYSGQCMDVTKLFYDLYKAHKETFGNYKCFNISFGEDTNYIKPFQFGNGLLTEGSKKLMLKYSDCLKQNGLDFSIIGERPAKYWNGTEFITESDGLKVLFFGKGYIIAKDFSFELHEKNSR